MNDNSIRIVVVVIVLSISIRTTIGSLRIPTTPVHNRSLANKHLIDRTPSVHAREKSNSIQTLRKRIANRQHLVKNNRTLLSTSTTQRIVKTSLTTSRIRSKSTPNIAKTMSTFLTTISEYRTTTTTSVKSFSTAPLPQTIDISKSSNTAIIAIIFICCFSGFLLFTFIATFLLREHFNGTYLKLPCIHSLSSTTKQSRASTPLFYSPIQSKFTVTEEFSVNQLYDIYMQKHAFGDLAFAAEFKSIPHFEELSCTSATRTTVASKNRFVNILPIDTTRVILNTLNNDPATDYINGNYISGYKCSNKFIATQGPKRETCEDFWRMIWELKLKSIVMLTNIIEGVSRVTKCHQYWPERNQTITYGSYQITCIDQQCSCTYEKRYFQLTKISNDEEFFSSSSVSTDDASSFNSTPGEQQRIRRVVQYHYTQWKDMDVPNDSHTLLHLIEEVNVQTNHEQYPIVVHCTAGVGRTGTYIAIDAMLDQMKQEGKVDICNFVVQMRRERHLMVQTVKQYVFIYRSILEYYLYGNTRIEANMFRSVYSNLRKNKQALLVSEYNKLFLLPVEHRSHQDAHSPNNINKNRCTQIVPYDYNRVCLNRLVEHPYINASFIEGYSHQCSFILTQDPLLETIDEFWRMFIEYDCACVVQLHTMIESSPPCAMYYPNDLETTMKIGSTSLLKMIEKEVLQEKFIIRKFCLTDIRETLSKTIYHYEYLPPISTDDKHDYGQCMPSTLTHSLFDFIGYINKRSNPSNQPRYITVHCGNGGPSCSIFCLSVILMDQLKSEQAVDIFQCVRALQRQRTAMITSLAQYEYFYELIRKFLEESFDSASMKLAPSLNNSIYDNDEEYQHF